MPSLRKSLTSPRRKSSAAAAAATSNSSLSNGKNDENCGPTMTDSSASSMTSTTVSRSKRSSGSSSSSFRNLTRSMSHSGGKLTSSIRRNRRHSSSHGVARSRGGEGEDVLMTDVEEHKSKYKEENENDLVTCENCGRLVPTMNLTLHAAACAGGGVSRWDADADADADDASDSASASAEGQDHNPITLLDDDVSNNGEDKQQEETKTEAQWSCPRCTLLNQPLAIQCGACRYVQPDHDPQASSTEPLDGIRDPDPSQRLRLISDEPTPATGYLGETGLPPMLEQLLQQHEYIQYERQHQHQQSRRRHADAAAVAAAGTPQDDAHATPSRRRRTTARNTTNNNNNNNQGTRGEVIVIYDDDEDGGVGFAPQHSSTFAQHEERHALLPPDVQHHDGEAGEQRRAYQVVERYHSPIRHGPGAGAHREVHLGATISESSSSSSSSSSSAASSNAPSNFMGGGAFLGGLLGGAMAFGRGRPISSGALEGAVTGAAGGAILSELLGGAGGGGGASVEENLDANASTSSSSSRARGRGGGAGSGLRRFLPGGGGGSSASPAEDATHHGTQYRIIRMGPDGTAVSTSNSNSNSNDEDEGANATQQEAMMQMLFQSLLAGAGGEQYQSQSMGGDGTTQPRLIFMRNPGPGQVGRPIPGNGTIMLPPGIFLQGRDSIDQMSYDELLDLFGTGTRVRPASAADISSLPTTTLTKAADLPSEKKSCSICLCDFENGDQMKMLPCLHGFHEECVDRWLGENGTCPVCKHSVVS